MHRADGVVVGVEKKAEVGVEELVGRARPLQHKLLEEPARMGEMPLGGTRVGHGLHDVVLGCQRGAKRDRCFAHLPVLLCQGPRFGNTRA